MAYRDPVVGIGGNSTPGTINKYISGDITFAAAPADGDIYKATMNHGLGGHPEFVQVWAECTTAEGGYAIGDRFLMNVGIKGGVAFNGNEDDMFLVATATALDLYFTCDGENGLRNARHKTDGRLASMTMASWKFKIVAVRFS